MVLERALDLTENCGQETSDSHTPETSFQHSFSDATFKMVPDVKTLISLRQNLVADKKSTCEEEEKKADGELGILIAFMLLSCPHLPEDLLILLLPIHDVSWVDLGGFDGFAQSQSIFPVNACIVYDVHRKP